MMNINDLLFWSVPEVCDLAVQAVEFRKQNLSGELTDDEFTELLDDLISLRRINQEMVSVEVMRELVEAANIIALIRVWMP